MITPDAQPEATEEKGAMMNSNEQCVPSAALAIDGTPPAVGDPVEYTVKGTVSRVEGDKAYVTPETINEQPASAEKSEPDAMEEAMKADEHSEYAGK